MIFETWRDVLTGSFQNIGIEVLNFLPNLIVGIIIFVLGWVIGTVLDRLVARVVHMLNVDWALRTTGVSEIVEKAGFRSDAGAFVGGLVKWFIIIVFLVATLDVLGLEQVNLFLQEAVLVYLPQVIVAVLILIVGAVLAEVVQRMVIGGARAAGVKTANFLGRVSKWVIWVISILAALFQLGIAAPLVQTLFTGLVIAVSLAVGLAFGLGGQDAAARYIEKVRGDIEHKG